MLSLHTNAATLSAQNSIGRTQSSLSTSMTRLSTGFRINSAMDDAAGLQIATRLKAQTSGMAVAMRNTQNSTSMLQTAEGALDEVTNMLVRMKDLATQAFDASSTDADKDAMQSEYSQLGAEIKNIMTKTTFGGKDLMIGGTLGTTGGMVFQIGASAGETMKLNLEASMKTAGTLDKALEGVSKSYKDSGAGAELNTAGAANTIITTIASAVDSVATIRSSLGAAANRLDHVYNNLANISTNTKNATGRIMDVDFATESANMTSKQMLMQAGTAMLKQTNSMSSMVMSLLQ
ncbi:flagellin [Massilia sp.]|uniref:flagellin N-terminal helical domain-containing protein n=1 Tax=Massilia sp. TaxID=1882437 RepID=UPI0028AC4E13|nr:flagellin [Massilia sp.]